MRPGDRLILLGLLGLAILGALAVLFVTRHGIGLSTDSVVYIDSARRLARGEGFTSGFTGHAGPVTHWPPLYSATLAGLALLGIDPLPGARVLALLLFAANVFVAGWLVWRHGTGKLPAVLASSLLVLVSADLIEVHSWGWTEPLFLLLCALGLHQLAVYLERPHSRRRLLAAAAFVALATLTRYLGVTVIIAGGLTILWLGAGRWLRRGVDALLFGGVSAASLALWMLRNSLLSGSPTSRELVVNPLGLEQLLTGARTVAAWLVPPILPGSLRMLLLVGALAAVVIGMVRGQTLLRELSGAPGGYLLRTLLCFVVTYGGFLALFIVLFDADVTFDSRLLSPVHFLLLVVVGLVLSRARGAHRWLWAGIAVVALLQAGYAAAWMRAASSGLGYAGEAWRESALWSAVEQLPEQTPLYSNAYDAVYIHTGRVTQSLPAKYNPNSLVADDDFRDRLAALRTELAQHGGVVVFTPLESWRRYMPTEAEIEEGLAPFESHRFPDGTLYRVSR